MAFHDSFWGDAGFPELKKCMKTSEEFCKEATAIMVERAELAASHNRSLAKLAVKAGKLAGKASGTLQDAWTSMVTFMIAEGDFHKTLAENLQAVVCKPLKAQHDEMHKERKTAETTVERSFKALHDRRNKENSSRSASVARSKEIETMTELIETGTKSDKEAVKLGRNLKKTEDLGAKCEKEYRRDCIEADRLRADHDHVYYHFCLKMQELDEAKTVLCQDVFGEYQQGVLDLVATLQQDLGALGESFAAIDARADSDELCGSKGTGPNVAMQALYSCYAEDMNNPMNDGRRVDALKARCAFFYTESRKSEQFRGKLPSDSEEEVAKVNSSIDYAQLCLFKLQQTVAEVEGSDMPEHPLGGCIETRLVRGVNISVASIPLTDGIFREASEELPEMDFDTSHLAALSSGSKRASTTLSIASHASYSSHISLPVHTGSSSSGAFVEKQASDEFDDDFDDSVVGQYTVLYDFEGSDAAELSLREGDTVEVLATDGVGEGWWEGRVNGRQGLFPANYVTPA